MKTLLKLLLVAITFISMYIALQGLVNSYKCIGDSEFLFRVLKTVAAPLFISFACYYAGSKLFPNIKTH